MFRIAMPRITKIDGDGRARAMAVGTLVKMGKAKHVPRCAATTLSRNVFTQWRWLAARSISS